MLKFLKTHYMDEGYTTGRPLLYSKTVLIVITKKHTRDPINYRDSQKAS